MASVVMLGEAFWGSLGSNSVRGPQFDPQLVIRLVLLLVNSCCMSHVTQLFVVFFVIYSLSYNVVVAHEVPLEK